MKKRRELLIIGDLTDAEQRDVAAYLKRYNLKVFSASNAVKPSVLLQTRAHAEDIRTRRTRGEQWLRSTPLPEKLPDTCDKYTAGEILRRVNIRTAYGLTQTTFDEFMVHNSLITWEYDVCTSIVEFMIAEGIVFADFNPALVFRTPIITHKGFKGMVNNVAHLRWVEMLAFMTEKETSCFGIGPLRMAKIKQVMSEFSIDFADEH